MRFYSRLFFVFACAIFFACPSIFSQSLIVDQSFIDEENKCFVGETDACVKIVADQSLKLAFQTNLEGIILPESKSTIGDEYRYILVFDLAKDPFGDRFLEISEPRSSFPCKIKLGELLIKQTLYCHVSFEKCFTLVVSNGLQLFSAGQYPQAKEQFLNATKCYDYTPGSIEEQLVKTDSIIVWSAVADENILLLDYTKAYEYYDKICVINPEDEQMKKKRDRARLKKEEYCEKCFLKANEYSKQNELEKAIILYQRIIDSDCFFKENAQTQLELVSGIIKRRKERNTVFTYEFALNQYGANSLMPIGFSVGGYRNKRWGGYFSFAMNTAFINMMRTDYPKAIKPNMGISFGPTVRPIRQNVPVWIHFGIGYNFTGAYLYKNENDEKIHYQGGTVPEQPLKIFGCHALPLEIGLLGKIRWVSLRYTFQYRLPFNKNYDKYIDTFMHSIGIGVAF